FVEFWSSPSSFTSHYLTVVIMLTQVVAFVQFVFLGFRAFVLTQLTASLSAQSTRVVLFVHHSCDTWRTVLPQFSFATCNSSISWATICSRIRSSVGYQIPVFPK